MIFDGFRSVAVNSVYKLQYFAFINYTAKAYMLASSKLNVNCWQGRYSRMI